MAAINPWLDEDWDAVEQASIFRNSGEAIAAAQAQDAGLINKGVFNTDPFPSRQRFIIVKMALGLTETASPPFFETDLVASISIGISEAAVVTAGPHADIDLGIDCAATVSKEADLTASMLLGIDEATTVSREQDLTANVDLGIDEAAAVSLETDIIVTISIGVDLTVAISEEDDSIVANMQLGIDEAALLELAVTIAASVNLGIDEAATVSREQDLTTSMDLGIVEAASVYKEAGLTAGISLGITEAAILSREQDLAASIALGISEAAVINTLVSISASPALGITESVILPSSTTFDSGSANYTVPNYGTLVIETWGAGSGSPGFNDAVPNGTVNRAAGGNGGASTATIGATVVRGNGGTAPDRVFAIRGASTLTAGSAGVGGTASGGDTNTSGSAGTSATGIIGTSATAGSGAAAPGGGGAAVTGGVDVDTLISSRVNGTAGNAPGGGASGGANKLNASTNEVLSSDGGSSGGYSIKTYAFGAAGSPLVGDLIPYVVGAGGTKGTATQTGLWADGAAGANGRVKFTVFLEQRISAPASLGLSEAATVSQTIVASFGIGVTEAASLGAIKMRKRTVYTSGSGTHTFDTNAITANIRVQGGGSGGQASNNGTNSSAGALSSFGTAEMVANGGTASGSTTQATATGGDINVPGGIGGLPGWIGATTLAPATSRGGLGSASHFGQGETSPIGATQTGIASTVPGAGGGGASATANGTTGGLGGNSGAFCEKLYTTLAAKAYVVGAGSAGATAAGAGGNGIIIVDEYW